MQKRYPITFKILLVFFLSLMALVVPYYSLKIVLSVIAIVLLGLTFPRFGVFFVVLAIVFIVLPFGVLNSSFLPFSFMKYYAQRYGISSIFKSKTAKVYPNKYIKSASNVDLNIMNGLEIVFDPTSTEIEIPSVLAVKRSEKKVEISSSQGILMNKNYVIDIGTKNGYDSVHIQSDGLFLKGEVGKKIKFFNVNCDGIYLSGNLKFDTVRVDCDGAYLDGGIDAKSVEINADGVFAHLMLKSTKEFSLNASGIAGDITYEDKWRGIRTLLIKGDGGYITVKIPQLAGELERETEGVLVKVIRY